MSVAFYLRSTFGKLKQKATTYPNYRTDSFNQITQHYVALVIFGVFLSLSVSVFAVLVAFLVGWFNEAVGPRRAWLLVAGFVFGVHTAALAQWSRRCLTLHPPNSSNSGVGASLGAYRHLLLPFSVAWIVFAVLLIFASIYAIGFSSSNPNTFESRVIRHDETAEGGVFGKWIAPNSESDHSLAIYRLYYALVGVILAVCVNALLRRIPLLIRMRRLVKSSDIKESYKSDQHKLLQS